MKFLVTERVPAILPPRQPGGLRSTHNALEHFGGCRASGGNECVRELLREGRDAAGQSWKRRHKPLNRELSDTRLSRVKMVIICSGGAWLVRVSRFAQTGADFRQRLLDRGALKSERINVKS
jgi:hypothetical protein